MGRTATDDSKTEKFLNGKLVAKEMESGDGLKAELTIDFDSTDKDTHINPDGFNEIVNVEDAEALRDDVQAKILPKIDFEGHDGKHTVGHFWMTPDSITKWEIDDEYRAE